MNNVETPFNCAPDMEGKDGEGAKLGMDENTHKKNTVSKCQSKTGAQSGALPFCKNLFSVSSIWVHFPTSYISMYYNRLFGGFHPMALTPPSIGFYLYFYLGWGKPR